jgi:hypothetical protein
MQSEYSEFAARGAEAGAGNVPLLDSGARFLTGRSVSGRALSPRLEGELLSERGRSAVTFAFEALPFMGDLKMGLGASFESVAIDARTGLMLGKDGSVFLNANRLPFRLRGGGPLDAALRDPFGFGELVNDALDASFRGEASQLARWEVESRALTLSSYEGDQELLPIFQARSDGRLLALTHDSNVTANGVRESRWRVLGDKPVLDCEVHHLCTAENEVSKASGGPWTPRFRRLFERVGSDLEDARNKVKVVGHFGPHPEEYHLQVFDRVNRALTTGGAEGFWRELARLSNEAATPGTEINQLITGVHR